MVELLVQNRSMVVQSFQPHFCSLSGSKSALASLSLTGNSFFITSHPCFYIVYNRKYKERAKIEMY
ncbi:hypothetical protein AMR76_03330 [Vibrio furnissii]|uniref:Uncharacterized protein n=1 Tax=Vibrio furnissii TaxID=29494 RepID=A0A0Q2MIU9_VIBFU|nr:hypothetical protein AMR76_03330 [Vibrio furnissii]